MADSASFALKLKDQFSAGAKKAAASLGLFGKGLKDTDKASGRFLGTQGRLTDSMGRGQAAADSYLTSTLKFEALRAGASAVIGLGSAMFESAGFTDQMTRAFDSLTHGQGAETLAHTRRMAEMLGLDVHDTTKAYKNFLALQFDPGMADKLLLLGSDMQALGSDAEDVKGIFRALGQIKSKGRVQEEEMLQLQERGVSGDLIKESLVKRLGLADKAELQKLQQAGKVSADDFFFAFEEAINKKMNQANAGDTGKKYAEESLNGMLGVMKAKATNIWDGLVSAGALKGISAALKSTGEQFEKFMLSPQGGAAMRTTTSAIQGLITTIGKGIPKAIGWVSKAIDLFNWMGDHSAPLIAAGMVLLAPAAFSAAAAGWAMATGWIAATAPLLLAAAAIGSVTWAISEAMKVDWGFIWDQVKSGASELWRTIKDTASSMATWAMDLGRSIVDGIVAGITGAVGRAVSAARGMAQSVIAAAKGALGIHSPSKEFESLGLYTGEGFTQGFSASMVPANDVVPEFGRRVSAPDFSRVSLSGMGGGPSINIEINVSASDGSPEGIAETVARTVREQVEDLLRDYADEVAA